MERICLVCGMSVDETVLNCPKCDNDLSRQHDGSTITVDIAHQGERVHEALRKMQDEIDLARKGTAMRLRFIVGTGRIREEVLRALGDLKFRGDILDFQSETSNPGAVQVRIK